MTFNGNVTSNALWTHSSNLKLTNTSDATSPTSTTAALQIAGGIACANSIYASTLGLNTNFLMTTAQINYTSPQTGATMVANVLRFRSNDNTNSTVGMSLGNSAPTGYYESQWSMFCLGALNSSTNYERVLFGVNSTGAYLNYLYGGTGVNRPLNIYSGALFSSGGALSLNSNLSILNTTDATSSSMTTAPLYVAGGAAINGTVFANAMNVGNVISLANVTASAPSSQNGTALPTNVLRLRTNDTTNTVVGVTLSNGAMANNYYESHVSLYTLGSTPTSTNVERMLLGVNSSGGYLNYVTAGSGTAKPFNVLQGSTFTNGGLLSLANALTVTGAQDVSLTTPAITSIYTAGGLYVTKQANITGTLSATGGLVNSIAYS
ncbi:MAG: hypothetical protein EOO61_18255, partial [Hymenobacter sp.]